MNRRVRGPLPLSFWPGLPLQKAWPREGEKKDILGGVEVATLAEMVAKGKRKFTAKAPIMKENYEAAKPLAKTNYAALPFGPRTKAAYTAGLDAGVYRVPDIDKWARNWEFAVKR